MSILNVSGWLHRARAGESEMQRLVADAKTLPAEEVARAVFRTVSLARRYRLVLVGPCGLCGRQAQSRPIRTSAHLLDLLRRFEPDPRTHHCPTLVERLGRLDRW